MMYGYMTLPDETEVVHSEMRQDGTVKVYMEQPTENGFNHATCILPTYTWSDIVGFSEIEINNLKKFVTSNAHIIIELSKEGGFANASNF